MASTYQYYVLILVLFLSLFLQQFSCVPVPTDSTTASVPQDLPTTFSPGVFATTKHDAEPASTESPTTVTEVLSTNTDESPTSTEVVSTNNGEELTTTSTGETPTTTAEELVTSTDQIPTTTASDVVTNTEATTVGDGVLSTSTEQPSTTIAPQNANNTSHNQTEVAKVEEKKKKEDGPSTILFPVCSGYLGIANRLAIKDDQMFASSTYDVGKLMKLLNTTLENTFRNTSENDTAKSSNFTITGNMTAPRHGRLGNALGSWCASGDDVDGDHHLVIDLGDVKIVEGVITQGRSDSDNWVTYYTVSHSSDKNTWHNIQKNGHDLVFKGNKDRNSLAVGGFPNRVAARYIKFSPKNYHGELICMRVEAVGCHPDAVNVAKNQPTTQSSTKRNFTSSKAVDGDFIHESENDTCTHTRHEDSPWLRIDLRRAYLVKEIFISDHEKRAGRDLKDFEVRVGKSLENDGNDNPLCSSLQTVEPGQIKTVVCKNGTVGRYINVRIPRDDTTLALCEVAVIGIAETIAQLGLDDIADSLKTGLVPDKTGEVSAVIGGLIGQLKKQMGGALLSKGLGMLSGQGSAMLGDLKGMGAGLMGNLDMLGDLQGQGLDIANQAKDKAMEMANKMKKQGMEMANKAKDAAMKAMEGAKKQGMEMANKAKEEGMKMANELQGQGMAMANDLQNQGMGMVGDMQGQMNQQQDKFKKKLKELLKMAKKWMKTGKREFEKFKDKGYIEAAQKYMNTFLDYMMKGMAAMQAKLMESLGNIGGDMSKQIMTMSEYDTSDVKGLLDDVDPVPVREFLDEARPKISEYITELERLANKYLNLAIDKGIEAKDEIEKEAESAASQATSMGKNVAGKATSMGKNMASKAQAVGMNAAKKAQSMGTGMLDKAKETAMKTVDKAKSMGMDAVNKAKAAGMDAVNNAKSMAMGAVDKAKGMGKDALGKGMDTLGNLKEAGLSQLQSQLSGVGKELLQKVQGKATQVKEMQQIQMLQNLKKLKQIQELQDKLKEEQDGQWAKFEMLNKQLEAEEDKLKGGLDDFESEVEKETPS